MSTPKKASQLALQAGAVLGLKPSALTRHLGLTARTAGRWKAGDSSPLPRHLRQLALDVQARDAKLAALLAQAGGATLESIQPRPRPELSAFADAVVCAAADAMGVTPRAVRPALAAAVARAKSLGVKLEELSFSERSG